MSDKRLQEMMEESGWKLVFSLVVCIIIGGQNFFLGGILPGFSIVGAAIGLFLWLLGVGVHYSTKREQEYKDEVKRAAEKINKEE